MKHLLNGVAIAAALAIAAPAWAQAPAAPKAPPAAAAPSAGAPMAPMASKQRHKRVTHTHKMTRGGPASTTDQLNREELARIQGGAPAGAPADGRASRTSTTPAAIGSPKQP